MKIPAILILMAIIILGCSNDPNKVSEQNFKYVINSYFDGKPLALSFNGLLDDFPKKIGSVNQGFERKRDILDRFATLGFLTAQEKSETISRNNPLSFKRENEKLELTIIKYQLTQKGKKHHNGSGFFYGQPEVHQIISFTDAAQESGKKVSTVTFNYIVTDMAEWVRNDIVKDLVPKHHLASAQTPIEGKCTLILTEDGWVYGGIAKSNK